MKKYFLTLTDAEGVVLDRFQVISAETEFDDTVEADVEVAGNPNGNRFLGERIDREMKKAGL